MPEIDLNGLELDAPAGGQEIDLSTVELDEPQVPSDFNLALQLVGKAAPGPMGMMAKGMTPLADGEPMESKGVRLAQGAIDPALGIAQVVPHTIAGVSSLGGLAPNKFSNMADELAAQQDAFTRNVDSGYNQMRQEDGKSGFDGWRMMGNVASPANLIPGKIAGSLGPASTLGQRVVKGAATGGIFGATAPVTDGDFLEEKAKQIGMGIGIGGGLPLVGAAAAKAINPAIDKAKQLLIDEGVRLTPGQIAGGWAKTAEDKLTSVPLMGDAITAARQRSIEDANKAVANRALEPIGKTVPKSVKAGRELINHVEDELGAAYNAIVPQLTGKIDQQFKSDLQSLGQMATSLGKDRAEQFKAILKNELFKEVSPNGTITGESLKKVESVLGMKARDYLKAQHPDDRGLGQAIREVQSSLRSLIARNHPQHAPRLKAINQGWAQFERMRGAAGMLGAPEGVFSPAQLANNVKKMGGRNQYARGDALMQDLSEAAKSVLPSKYPDSGTAGRYLLGAGALGGGYFSPATLGGIGLGAAAYTRPGQSLLQYMMANPKLGKASAPAANMLRKATSPSDLAALIFGP